MAEPLDEPRSPQPECVAWHSAGVRRFSRIAIRELDRLAAEEFGIPSIVLMENAGIRIAEFAAGVLAGATARSALVVCGPGNNGGDGLAAARHLVNGGFAAAVVLAGAQAKGDAGVNLDIVRRVRIPLFDAGAAAGPDGAVDRAIASLGRVGLVIDALLGTGGDRAPREPVRSLVSRVNGLRRSGIPVLSVDIPSGLDADTGIPAGGTEGIAVEADWTVTLVGPKLGFEAPEAGRYLGRVHTADIGVPRELVERMGIPADGPGAQGG